VTELGYIGIGVKDLRAWQAFACDILGLEWFEEESSDGRGYLRTDYWHHRIALHPDGTEDMLYAGFRVAGPEEFQQMQLNLRECNIIFTVATPAEADDRQVLELLRLEDPAGNPLEIFHGPLVDANKPMRPGRGMHGHFLTGTGGLGHIVVRDRGRELSYKFYSRVLGMRGNIEARMRFGPNESIEPTFMHCNDRDHSIAFGAGPMKRRIHHVMFEVDNVDDVGLAYDLCQKMETPILMSLGKHANDHMLSFYVQTPSGWFCEYGARGRPASHQSEYNRSDMWGHKLLGKSLLGGL
jgi:2,3-dihydroxyethylbenzene 1,2-dioxygenase